jgi:hypothetical protein
MSIIRNIIKWFIPYGIILYRRLLINEQEEKQEQKREEKQNIIINYLVNLKDKTKDEEIISVINFFENNGFSVFPYDFIYTYFANKIKVFYDRTCNMKYVLHENKKMYFPVDWTEGKIKNYYNGLLTEQDADSPHRYETNDYKVEAGDVIVDIGSAEGIWALTYVENAKKIYLFECQEHWIQALLKTFEPWKNKVEIIKKYVSNSTKGNEITLDDFLQGKEIDFIKADIEGAEIRFLEGAAKTISNTGNLRLLICTYHKQDDAEKIKGILIEHGFSVEYSKGYMIFIYDKDLKEPYIRRGLIRARK